MRQQGVEHDARLRPDVRQRVYNYIFTNPGATFKNINGVMDMNEGTLRYYLQYLEKQGKVVSKVEANNRCYYTFEGRRLAHSPDISSSITRSLSGLQRQMLVEIMDHPGTTVKQLEQRFGRTRELLKRDLKKLQDLHLVISIKRGSSVVRSPVAVRRQVKPPAVRS